MLFIILFLTGLLAGAVDAIAGGGGLISLPMLLTMGMPPHIAFGTNKIQSGAGTLMAARRYYRHGLISFKESYPGILSGLFGASSGAIVSQLLSSALLNKIIPILLAIIFLYTLFTPRLGRQESKPRISPLVFYLIFGFVLGFYDGFFGPGTGALWVFVLMLFLGQELVKATAYTKIFNLNSNVVAMVCFIAGGNVNYPIALTMAAGQLLGGRLGAALALKKGAKIIRPLFLIMVSMTIFSLVYKNHLVNIQLVERHYLIWITAGALILCYAAFRIFSLKKLKTS